MYGRHKTGNVTAEDFTPSAPALDFANVQHSDISHHATIMPPFELSAPMVSWPHKVFCPLTISNTTLRQADHLTFKIRPPTFENLPTLEHLLRQVEC
ncbi:hypothetical protein PSHT_03114 [Puccinia striiformis]|uniref:Uncharacterized protein n=1 Tax=Puccinia striiformis TaxID=27350 RepID=A0A2S4WGH4_9BASI|nr:hypothetical protein PSHT_03114 [Puccinia striiformis]